MLAGLCPECDELTYPYNFQDVNCSTSGFSTYFTAALVYSNPQGTTTASTLINMLLTWVENPLVIINNDTILSLSSRCLNVVSCIRLLNLVPSPLMVNQGIDVPLTTGVFFTGIVIGVTISTFLIGCIIW